LHHTKCVFMDDLDVLVTDFPEEVPKILASILPDVQRVALATSMSSEVSRRASMLVKQNAARVSTDICASLGAQTQ